MSVARWTVLSRPDCSLCETMQWELAQLLGPQAQIHILDITGDAELERKYGQRIPVLLADADFVCAYRLEADRVRGYLSAGRK